jgi:hypothetical protein
MTNVGTSSRRAFGLHIYIYFWLAFVGLGIAVLLAVSVPIRDVEMPENAILALLSIPFIFWAVLGWSLWRCSSADFSGIRGLLFVTAYMAVGIGGFSMLIAIPAVMFAMLWSIGIALVSLFRGGKGFALQKFRSLVLAYHRHRMFQ